LAFVWYERNRGEREIEKREREEKLEISVV